MNKREITPYLEIRDRLSTFTIINCEHKGLLWRMIGHTAVVYKCQETGQLMVFESNITVSKLTGKSGVRLTPMGLWVSQYPGKVFVRIPTFNYPDTTNSLDELIRIGDLDRYAYADGFVKNHLGSSYPDLQTWSGKMKLVLAALDLKIFGKDLFTYKGNDAGIFCTMLVILFLQYCGLMSMKTEAKEWEPDDTRVDFTLKHLLINCAYGKEIQIK